MILVKFLRIMQKLLMILGMQLAEKYGENLKYVIIGAHHDEIEMTSLISPLIQVCDAVSGG